MLPKKLGVFFRSISCINMEFHGRKKNVDKTSRIENSLEKLTSARDVHFETFALVLRCYSVKNKKRTVFKSLV